MKIGVVLNTSWNVYNFRMGVIRALQEKGHKVVVIAPCDTYSDRLIEAGCEFHEVKMDSRGANPIKDFGLIIELYNIYKKVRPDVLLQYTIKPNIYGTIAASRLKIPVINNVCGLGTVFLKKGFVPWLAQMMYKFAFRLPKKVFFQNQDDFQLFINKGLVKERIADLVPGSGINMDAFKVSKRGTTNTFTFLMVSRLIHDKGVLEFVDAVKLLKQKGVNANFKLLGPTDPRGIEPSLIKSWVDQNIVEYLGRTDDVQPFLHEADCVVLPSYREGTPRTLLEAACVEKPIIATDVPGCNHVVKDGYNGLLCRLKDPSDLAEKMHRMLHFTKESRNQMGANGREQVKTNFDERIVISKYLEAIEGVAKS